jgi:ribonuclease-3
MIGRHMEQDNDREIKTHLLEDIMEAFIGALFEDSNKNYEICKTFFITLIEQEVDFARLINEEKNYKDILLRHFHKMKWNPPRYKMIEQIGEEKKIFKMCVLDNDDEIIGTGCGTTKKNGEQYASKMALIKYHVLDDICEIDEEIFEE